MDVLNTKPPELNPEDVSASFQRITDYLYKTMETIDFTLSKNRKQISEADGSASGLQEQINGVRGDLVLLSSALVSVQNRLNTLTGRVNSAEGDISAIQESIGTINGTLEDFEKRISALENPTP